MQFEAKSSDNTRLALRRRDNFCFFGLLDLSLFLFNCRKATLPPRLFSCKLNAKSQCWEVLSLFTIQGNLQFARANINNRHRGRERSAYKIWIQGSAIMRSAFVHCVGKISPPNNSFIHPYRFLKCSVLPSHHSAATQQQAWGLNFHSCIIFDSPCKVCSPVSR